MYNKNQLDVLAILDSYLSKTSDDVIKKDIQEISEMKFVGTSAVEYFENFHKYHQNPEVDFPERAILPQSSDVKNYKIL